MNRTSKCETPKEKVAILKRHLLEKLPGSGRSASVPCAIR